MEQKRIVVKVGSSSLTDASGCISMGKMAQLVEQLANLQKNHQIILVSSGAMATGKGKIKGFKNKKTIPEKQAAAAIGQGLLIEQYQKLFAEKGIVIAQLLLTRSDIEHRHRFIHIRNTLETLLRSQVIPIVNENDTVAVEEIRFGDNDTLSSLVAIGSEADLLVLLTDIDGFYTANPNKSPDAKKINEVWEITSQMRAAAGEQGSKLGTGGMKTKLVAAQMATQSGIDVVIASGADPTSLQKICEGKQVGTHFYSQKRMTSRKSWIAYGTRIEGSVIIDQGAVDALLYQSRSLLIAGIVGVSGDFLEGRVVDICSMEDHRLGKGVISFSSSDLQLLLQRKQQGEKLRNIHEVIHRDHMVLFQPQKEENFQ